MPYVKTKKKNCFSNKEKINANFEEGKTHVPSFHIIMP
jgi:hypothetical protein